MQEDIEDGGFDMIKDIIAANEAVTSNEKQIAVLREHFPACFSADGSFDIERFKEYLSDKVSVTNEGYELRFLGKNYARLLASLDTTTVIVPDEAHNSKPENANSQNVYISGDNLDGLKHLLKSYAKSVKCIYIDPPYNTGTDGFVYNDSFNFTVEELADKLSISDEQASRILDLTKRGSASHSAWLLFIYTRLLLARDLLAEDGAIIISIDNNEACNLKIICDDVFGEENFAGQLPRITKKSGKDHTNGIASNHDFLLVYLKNNEMNVLSGTDAAEEDYTEKDEFYDERGPYKLNQTLDYDSLWYNPTMDFKLSIDGIDYYPGGSYEKHNERHAGKHNAKDWVWRWSQAKFDFGYANGFVVIKQGKDRPRIYTKTYYKAKIAKSGTQYCIKSISRDKKLSSISFVDNRFSNDNATKEIGDLMDKNLFDFPKPTSLISGLLDLLSDNCIVLDFFSGSGTTAHAVMQKNADDGGSRRFIMIQLQEKMKNNSYGFSTIDELGIERIKLAAEKISESKDIGQIDLGFRHFTLVEPSAETLDKLEKFEPESGFLLQNTVLQDFGVPTVLATWLVRDGYGFTAPVQSVDFNGYTGYYIDKHLYLINPGLKEEAIAAITEKYETDGAFKPENVVLCGYSFTWTETESLKVNLARLKDTEKNLRINFHIRY